jgi:transcriptional regulator with XRE-family HTH domain
VARKQTPGERIYALRMKEGLSLNDVSRMTGDTVSEATLSRIERDLTADPWPRTKYAIALALGVEPVAIWHPTQRPTR